MKNIFVLALFLVSYAGFAQTKKDSTEVFEYHARHYDTTLCKTCPLKPGEKVPYSHPYAIYINDASLWEWRELGLGVGEPQKVYDLKPQYKDTLKLKDGTIMEVPFWIKKNSTKKPKTTP